MVKDESSKFIPACTNELYNGTSNCLPCDNRNASVPVQTLQVAPPIDSGWAWLVLIGCFTIHLLLPSTHALFGILYVHKIQDFHLSTTSVAWIFNLSGFFWDLTGIFVGPLVEEFGWRRVAGFGSLLASLSVIITSHAGSLLSLYFTFSLYGIGSGLAFTVCHLCIPHYFEKRRGLAFSITTTGVSVGFFVLPLFFRYLQETYGFNGTVLIYGGCFLHTVVSASLFHPIEWHSRPVNVLMDPLKLECNKNNKCTVVNANVGLYIEEDFQANINEVCRPLKQQEEIPSIDVHYMTKTSAINKKTYCVCSFAQIFKRVMITTRNNFSELKNFRVLLICISSGCILTGYLNFMVMIPLALHANNFTLQVSAYCISLSAIFNAIGRLTIPFISDYTKFHKHYWFMGEVALMGLSIIGFAFVQDLNWIMGFMITFGFGIGGTMGLYTIVMIEVVGLEKLSSTFSMSSFFISMFFITFGTLTGYIRDVTDSYTISNCILGCLILTAFFLWLLMPFAKKYDLRNKQMCDKKDNIAESMV